MENLNINLKDLEKRECTIDELLDTLKRVSLVTEPAIEKDFFYYNKEFMKELKFKTENIEQRIVTGPAMVPDMDILRLDEKTNKYYYNWFSKETIRKYVELYFKNNDINSTNLEHKYSVDGITTFESWIVDNENGKGGGKNYEDATDGTWMISMKIDNDNVWNNYIKTGIVRGFSIEGYFKEKKTYSSVDIYDQIVEILKNIED